jgi:uncharacterized membrane protein YeaQ/YmgE (transglycosylase-associated protein family)
MGILANIVVGIAGSVLGFWLAGLLRIATGGGFMRWLVAVLGAVVLIALLKALNIFR